MDVPIFDALYCSSSFVSSTWYYWYVLPTMYQKRVLCGDGERKRFSFVMVRSENRIRDHVHPKDVSCH